VSTIPIHSCDKLEGFAPPGRNNSWIVEWLSELAFPTIALDFDNSFTKMATFMEAASDDAAYVESRPWQGAVSRVCDLWFDDIGSAQLYSLNPELKGRVMRVGDYDRNVSSRAIKDILSPFDEAKAVEEDDDDDDGGLAAFTATDAESILNELSKVSDGDQTASLHKRLKPLAISTRARYEKYLVRYILFTGATIRTLMPLTSCGTNI
jgi:hypothetical protein